MMITEAVIATNNNGKLKEFEDILSEYKVKTFSLAQFPNVPEIVEDGKTFEENAKKKAEVIANYLNLPAIADDSGLMVDYLNGQPGIYSARFSGEDHNDTKNNQKLLQLLEGVGQENRNAKFVSAIAFAIPNKPTIIVTGEVKGYIVNEPKGSNGFGYDPLFYLPQYQKTMAELPPNLKNEISHRANALKNLIRVITKF